MTTLSGPKFASIRLSTEVTLPYVEQGDPAGTPVLLLHGITDSWRSFEPVLLHLPDSIHAFALTQRGHGDADRPATGYHHRDFAADVAAFLDAFGLESAVIVGSSLGSTVAQRFARDYPGRASGLVLAASFATYGGNPAFLEFAATISTLTDPIDPGFCASSRRARWPGRCRRHSSIWSSRKA